MSGMGDAVTLLCESIRGLPASNVWLVTKGLRARLPPFDPRIEFCRMCSRRARLFALFPGDSVSGVRRWADMEMLGPDLEGTDRGSSL